MSLNLDKSTWRRVVFGDVVRNVNETVKDAESAGIDRVVAMEHLDPGVLKVGRWGSVADGTTFTRKVKPGQTLFGKRRAYQRKVAYAEFKAICSGDIYTFEADDAHLLGELLPFLVQSNRFFEHALSTSAGSLSPRTNWRDLANFAFDLPPLDEQKRIADLLWAIERHRRALLVARGDAIVARLSWLDDTINSFNEARHQTVGQLIATGEVFLLTGPFGSTLSAKEFISGGIPVIHPSHIREGRASADPKSTLTPERVAQLSRWQVAQGDIVLMRKGDVGRSAIITADQVGWIISSDCISIRLSDSAKLGPEFLRLALSTPKAMETLLKNAPGTTMPGINERSLRPISVPALTPPEQAEIVRCNGQLENLAGLLSAELGILAVVRSSVLSQVFGGN